MSYIPEEAIEGKINFDALDGLDDVVYDDGSQAVDDFVPVMTEGLPYGETSFQRQYPNGIHGWDFA